MSCEPWREAISTRADGEASPIDARLLEAHLDSCPACTAFAGNVHLLRRAASVAPAEGGNDIAGQVVKAARAHDRRSVWWVLRIGLGVVAAQVFVLSAPALFLGHSEGSNSHAARHLGSFSVAYSIGLLVVALRPAKARSMLPLAAALAGCLVITAIIDVAGGHTPAVAEVDHLPEAIGLLLVWLLAMPRRLPRSTDLRSLPRLAAAPVADPPAEKWGRQSS